MANHASDPVIFARFPDAHFSLLGACYSFEHWHIAKEENFVWVKNILDKETRRVTLQRIPDLLLLEQVDDQLYPYQHLLPWGLLPALDWQPIQKALKITLPTANPNFLGLRERLTPRLVTSTEVQDAAAVLVAFESFCTWANTAPAWRLKALTWTIVKRDNTHQALVFGAPLPSLSGVTYWQSGRSLLPAGYTFEETAWSTLLAEHLGDQYYWLWDVDGHYLSIPQSAFISVTRSSVRQTQTHLSASV